MHETLPPLGLIYKCLIADIDLENDEEVAVYIWFWDDVCGSVTGATNWCGSIKYYKCMHEAVSQVDKEVSSVPFAPILFTSASNRI